MDAKEASKLKVGDQVQWEDGVRGVVIKRLSRGCIIDWEDQKNAGIAWDDMTKVSMAPYRILERFVVVSNRKEWGRGVTLKDAAKNANALAICGTKIKRGQKAWGFKFFGFSPVDEEKLKYHRQNYALMEFNVGDCIEPFVDSHGSVVGINCSMEELGALSVFNS